LMERAATSNGGRRVVRGGSFLGDTGWARVAFRNGEFPGIESSNLGFRVVLPDLSDSLTLGPDGLGIES
jgi:formylglycine-generating enzyme required for sulfatase activity